MNEISHVKNVDQYVDEISGAWHRACESIIHVGSLCASARIDLKPADLKILKSKLRMNDATFSKLIKISQDSRITDQSNQSYLPPSYGTLYELTHLTDDEFRTGIADGIVRPDMQRKDVESLRTSTVKKATTKPKPVVLITISATDDLSEEDAKLLKKRIAELSELPSFIVHKSKAYEYL